MEKIKNVRFVINPKNTELVDLLNGEFEDISIVNSEGLDGATIIALLAFSLQLVEFIRKYHKKSKFRDVEIYFDGKLLKSKGLTNEEVDKLLANYLKCETKQD